MKSKVWMEIVYRKEKRLLKWFSHINWFSQEPHPHIWIFLRCPLMATHVFFIESNLVGIKLCKSCELIYAILSKDKVFLTLPLHSNWGWDKDYILVPKSMVTWRIIVMHINYKHYNHSLNHRQIIHLEGGVDNLFDTNENLAKQTKSLKINYFGDFQLP